MREYLYIWHNPEEHYVVASGIEFRVLAKDLGKGIILLEHDSENSSHDEESGFDYVPLAGLAQLAAEDIYSWGNFSWVDYAGSEFPRLSPQAVAELLYFGHAKRPLKGAHLVGVGNCFLVTAHDD